MAILNSIILTLFQAIILFVIIKILNNINYNFRDYISILGIIIPSTIVFYFFNTKAMIVLLIGSAIFIYFKNKVIGLVSILIIFFILYIANFLSIWLAAMIYDYI
ncbi:ATP-binding protein, partial [Staphylococcus succinus]